MYWQEQIIKLSYCMDYTYHSWRIYFFSFLFTSFLSCSGSLFLRFCWETGGLVSVPFITCFVFLHVLKCRIFSIWFRFRNFRFLLKCNIFRFWLKYWQFFTPCDMKSYNNLEFVIIRDLLHIQTLTTPLYLTNMMNPVHQNYLWLFL